MVGSLMYLTSSRPDIMFAVCACARYQVNLNVSHLHAMKMIFRYLKGQQKIGLWYPKDSPFDLVAYTNSDYAGASLDRKSTTRGCQFRGCRLISWQCKKQTVVANSTTKAEYMAASSYCGQKTYNNDKNLSEVQLEHEKEDKFMVVVVKETLGGRGGESFWERGDDFGEDVLRFHTCLTDILGFLEKLEWWFEQDIDKEEERFEEDEDGGEV
nr:putative ribonuclease H-like domain-containing protein [Tanacetum cinerariifolium]